MQHLYARGKANSPGVVGRGIVNPGFEFSDEFVFTRLRLEGVDDGMTILVRLGGGGG
jgi:hypothetical protein